MSESIDSIDPINVNFMKNNAILQSNIYYNIKI